MDFVLLEKANLFKLCSADSTLVPVNIWTQEEA